MPNKLTNQNIKSITLSDNKLSLVKEGNALKICNYANNYYGDQQCITVNSQNMFNKNVR